jgi:hypothetical protein
MKVEVFIIFLCVFIFFSWAIWFRISNKILLKRYYRFHDGKGKNNRETSKGEGLPGKTEFVAPRPSKPPKRGILEATDINSVGKNCKGIRGFFGRIRNR